MKCSQCENESKRSTVRVTPRHLYWMASKPPSFGSEQDEYWDEDGAWHTHNGKWHDQQYTCSEGHEWNIRWRYGCESCDFGGEKEVTPLEPRKMVPIGQVRFDGGNWTLDGVVVEALPR